MSVVGYSRGTKSFGLDSSEFKKKKKKNVFGRTAWSPKASPVVVVASWGPRCVQGGLNSGVSNGTGGGTCNLALGVQRGGAKGLPLWGRGVSRCHEG